MSFNYSEKLKDPRWQFKRWSIIERDNNTCQYCFAKETWPKNDVVLEVHHFEYAPYPGEPWDVPDSDLITLCMTCHSSVMKSRDREREITGARERARLTRREQLQFIPAPTDTAKFMERQREMDHEKQLEIASVCTCPECKPELVAAAAKKLEMGQ